MAKGFTVFIGLRYLRSRKEGFISIINFISVAGIALGVAAVIIVISVMTGFDMEFQNKIIGTNAHVIASSYFKDGISDYQDIVEKISRMDHVKSVTPYFLGQVILKSRDSVDGIMLWGIIPDSMTKVNDLGKNMIKGDIDFVNKELPGGERGIVIGKEIMTNLNVDMDDNVTLISPVFEQTPMGMIPKMSKLKVVGVFDAGFYEYNSSFAYVSIDTAQKLFNKGNVITGIAIKLDNVENSAMVAQEIHRKFKNLWARDWMAMQRNLFQALQIEKLTMFIIMTLIMLVATFNIAGTLIMVVMRKTKDIGILKSMGATSGDIMNVFITQGLATGVIGTFVGFVFGVGVCIFLKIHPIAMPGGGAVYYIDKMPIAMNLTDIAIICATSIILSFLSTIYPAWQASKLDPVEAIRYE